MAEKLTPQQAEAVHNRGGNLLVSAAAGSGKTKVLVDRLLTYLTDRDSPADLDEFLIITYTKAAASELRGKIAAKLTQRIAEDPENRHLQKQMQRLFLTKISTVHGFCGDLLRDYAYKLDIAADFRVGDETECRELRSRVMEELLDRAYSQSEENPAFLSFVDTQGLGRDDRLVPEIIEKVYDSARCHLNPDQWLQSCEEAVQLQQVTDASQTVWGRYLMDDLFAFLDRQIAVFTQCIAQLDGCDGMEKPAQLYRSTLEQLNSLRQAQTWDAVVSGRSIDFGRLNFPRKNNPDPELTERVRAARNACKKELEKKLQSFTDDSAQVLSDLSQSAEGVRGLVALVRQFETDYAAAKRSHRILDFSDLEHKTLDLLLGKNRSQPTAAAREIAQRYREIMVDEYQDSNGVQDKIFEALTTQRHNCFLVGDVKQSIYQFRLADPGIFLEKYHAYLPAEQAASGDGRKVLLSHNFRSGAEVISCVNDVFRACMRPAVGGLHYTDAEALREGIPHEPLPDSAVELYAVSVAEETYPEEAAFVAQRIEQMLRSGTLIRGDKGMRPVRPDDIVILLRSPGSAAVYFQTALEARGIRVNTGSGTDLMQSQEVATLRAFLQTILNPRQDIPLISVLVSPVFGFTADDLAQIRGKQKKGFFFDSLESSGHLKAASFLQILKQLRQDARMNPLTVLLEKCLSLTKMDSVYAAMPGGEARTENIQQFFRIAADYEAGTQRDLSQFLEHLDALEERGLVMEGASGAGCVTIMSIHKSKGLEFPVVFLSNLSRNFNQESIRAQILCDKELGLGLSAADHGVRVRYPSISKRAIAVKMLSDSISEEMRVLYVAMTRARDRLVMTYAVKDPGKDLSQIALRLDFDNGELLCREAVCLGDWVMMAAMQRMEAGALHSLGGRPNQLSISEHPWKICVVEAPQCTAAVQTQQWTASALPAGTEDTLRKNLSFVYPHLAATAAPSKQTATDRKGREKDAEAAEHTQVPKQSVRNWRKPAFLEKHTEGKTYGSAIHAALQYIRYENCENVQTISAEIRRLVDQGFLTPEQGELTDCSMLARFFDSEIGRKLRSGTSYLREFKFSILDDGVHFSPDLQGEKVLLQGVVDCALLEDDGITVVDFKTDHVTEQTLESVVQRYRPQVHTYAEALGRIYEQPVKAQYLYFFRINRFVAV